MGSGDETKDNTDQFNGMRFTVCMFLPMEVITVTKPVDTVAISSLTDIPSEIQVRPIISSLYKNKRSFLICIHT